MYMDDVYELDDLVTLDEDDMPESHLGAFDIDLNSLVGEGDA